MESIVINLTIDELIYLQNILRSITLCEFADDEYIKMARQILTYLK